MARPDIQIDGSGIDTGFDVAAARTTIHGLSITSFATGVLLEPGSEDALIRESYLGVGLDGATAAPLLDSAIEVHGTGHVVRDNVISGNFGTAVDIQDDAADATVAGNIIGATADEELALGNGSDAISIFNSPGHVIGGSGPGDGNLIVDNDGAGIIIIGIEGGARDIVIKGNQIGDQNFGGNVDGVDVFGGVNVLIGGTARPTAIRSSTTTASACRSRVPTVRASRIHENSIAHNGDLGIAGSAAPRR